MKTLIIGPSWVGDMVMAQSLFRELKRSNNKVVIDVLAPAWSEPLLQRMPEVNKTVHMPLGHGQTGLGVRYQLAKSLRHERYDQAIVLPNSLKSGLIPLWAKIPKRTGWRGEMRYGLLNDIRTLDKKKYPLMVERFVALAHGDGLIPEAILPPSLCIDEEQRQLVIKSFGVVEDKPLLALCPGAEFGPSKQWPVEKFANIAQKKIDEGWQVLIFGSENDAPVAEEIASKVLECTGKVEALLSLAGKTSLAEAIDLLSLAEIVVSNDSGLMHVAAALDRKLVAIYGSTSPDFTPPLNKTRKLIKSDLDCAPCFERECPLGHGNCLKQINHTQVLDAMLALQSGK